MSFVIEVTNEKKCDIMDRIEITHDQRKFLLAEDNELTVEIAQVLMEDEGARRCLESGMNAHLAKPLQMEKVMVTIAKYYGKKNERNKS